MKAERARAIEAAAQAIAEADALLIGAGAGMGVDSGLPDFRGDKGFWRAYPPFAKLGLSFVDLANPRWFDEDPELAWGFYGHRLELYRSTIPHEGFTLLSRWGQRRPLGLFVFTSNVDGQFQRAGFDEVGLCEVHGSIHHFQCSRPCCDAIWSAKGIAVEVDAETMRAREPLPRCERCGALARPNILMFGDFGWLAERSDAQHERLAAFEDRCRGARVVIVECGAGTGVPTVRWHCEGQMRREGATLIRINPREAHGPSGIISIDAGAQEALEGIGEQLATIED